MVWMNIHFETFDDDSFKKVRDLSSKGPIAISISPWQISKMQDYQIKELREILKKPGFVLGQQGLNHKCLICSKEYHNVDLWHENAGLWCENISIEDQERFMIEGREKLVNIFGKEPELYVPPNHLFNKDTLKAAFKIGYKWVTDRAKIPLKPYTFNRIIIVPESGPEISENNQIYIHADRWRGDLEKILKKKFESFHEIKSEKNNEKDILINREFKLIGKIARDFVNGYQVPNETANELAKLIYKSKFKNNCLL